MIKIKELPSKTKTIYNQILQFAVSLEKLLDKTVNIFDNSEFYRLHNIRQSEYFINLEAVWLTYIYSQTSKADTSPEEGCKAKW